MIVRPESAAFPYLDGEGELAVAEVGLTKRELFASMALQGMLANPAVDGNEKDLAIEAVEYADALVKELNDSDKHQRVGSIERDVKKRQREIERRIVDAQFELRRKIAEIFEQHPNLFERVEFNELIGRDFLTVDDVTYRFRWRDLEQFGIDPPPGHWL